MTRSTLRLALLVLVCVGCKTYPRRTAEAFRDFQRGHLASSIEAYSDADAVGSEFLSGAEAGTAALAAGDWDAALRHLDRAHRAAGDIEGRALVGTERLAEGLASWAWNDTRRAYVGEGFERVYVHAGLALAYLAQGLLEEAGVEVRRANRLLEAEEELYETSYQAGGWGHLISAVAYELRGEREDAYIDYKRMVEKGVGTEIAGKALVRLASDLNREDELPTWVERFGAPAELPPGAASVVVLAGVGLAPYKVEGSIAVPTHDGIVPFAAPAYHHRPQPVVGLRLVLVESGESVRTDVVEDVGLVAPENLEDRLLWMAAKSVARGLLKRELTKKMEAEWGFGGRVAGDLFAFVSERADLRSWRTLPDTWQAARLFVPPGAHSFALEAIGGATRHLGTYELEPGETLVVIARSVDTHLYAHAIGGRPIELPGVPAVGEAAAVPGATMP